MSAETGTTWLVGDVGATNARFGLVSPDGAVLHSSNFACADFAETGLAIEAYLALRGNLPMPRQGALAIAALITGDEIRMTNHPWRFSLVALRDGLGFERLVAINDFTAVALALPRLSAADRVPVGGGVYIAGGIVPRLGARFVESAFRARFEAKGRLSTHLAAIPSYVVTHPLPAFLGCVAALAAA